MKKENGNRELTVTAIVLGAFISVVFGAANAYLGLRVGLTVSASIPAAVVSMGILRFVLRRSSILENNLMQTIGSAGEALASGAIFTMPALYLWSDEGTAPLPGVVALTVLALAGGLLGVLFMIPLRKSLIESSDATLVYPEGRACADVLRAGDGGGRGALAVLWGFLAAVFLKLAVDVFKWIPAAVSFPFRRLRGEMGYDFSAAMPGVGFILGPRIAGVLFAGAFFGWMVLIPVFSHFVPAAEALYQTGGATAVWRNYVRFTGAGAIAVGGIISVVKALPTLVRSFRGATAARAGREDLPRRFVIGGVLAVCLALACLPGLPVGFGGAVLMALFGFFFAAVSARMVGLVGSSNNPVSGMTIVTLVIAASVLKLSGAAGAAGMVTAMCVGSVVCIVAAIAGDTAQDLKTGHLVGATPWRQQIGELVGVVASGLAITGVLCLLHRTWGFGSKEIAAPQALLMKSIVEGIMAGTLPWGLFGLGACVAVVLNVLRVPVMPFAIGIYLPFGFNAAIFAGGLLRAVSDRRYPKFVETATLLAAGLIAGEGICGILLALF